MKIVKTFEDLPKDWKEIMIKQTEEACSFNKIYSSINLTRRYHENLLSENKEYRDHYELCKDIIQDRWTVIGRNLIFDRNASAATYGLIMRNMFNWDKEETGNKNKSNTPTPEINEDEIEKFKNNKKSDKTFKVINK